MSNNCQIPTPIQYGKTMLDYAGYQKGLYGKKYWRILAEKEMFYVRLQEDMSRIRCCAGKTGQIAK